MILTAPFQRIGNRVVGFYRRRKKRIITVAVICGAIYYIARRLRIAHTDYEREQLVRLKMQTYFESAQKTCDETVAQFLPTIQERVSQYVEVPSPEKLRAVPKEQKLAVWEECKINSFTKTLCAVYSVCLLDVFLRLQVNIVGRYLYLESIRNPTQEARREAPFGSETQKKYLSYAEYLVARGLMEMSEFVKLRVLKVLANWPLQRRCSYEDVLKILWDIRYQIESPENLQDDDNVLQFLLPPEVDLPEPHRDLPIEESDKLHMLLNETRNIMESVQFQNVIKSCLNRAFLHLTHNLRFSFLSSDESGNLNATTTPLTPLTYMAVAKVLPCVTKQFNYILASQPQNDIVNSLAELPQLQEYSYYVFTKTIESFA